jgi:hypothetical protein
MAQHEGHYEIVASNSIGSSSKICKLQITEPPKITQNLASTTTAVEDERVEFTIKTDRNEKSKIKNVEWFCNSSKISNETDINYEITTVEESTYSLHILKIMRPKSLLHEGTYFARITNEDGLFVDSIKGKLEVNYKPKFLIIAEDQNIKLDSTPLKLNYKVDAKPKAVFTW